VNPNPTEGFFSDPTRMVLPPAAAAAMSYEDDPNKKVRKPYTITKSRESWSEPEHDKFLEALQLFDRDWKKIKAFVGSKTVIQIRSHAQKYFLKVEKSGTNEHLPPPRPKRKAAHPYPQKAPKNAPVLSQVPESFQTLPVLAEPVFRRMPDSSTILRNPVNSVSVDPWTENSEKAVNLSYTIEADMRSVGEPLANNCCSSIESTPRIQPACEMTDQGNLGHSLRVLPDFAQVYGFIGSVFDPNSADHLQELKKMDPIDVETVLLLMRNLSINLSSPDFEEHRRLLSSSEIDPLKDISGVNKNPP